PAAHAHEPTSLCVRPRHLPEGVVAPALQPPVGLDRARLGAAGAEGAEEPALGVGPRHLAEGIAAPALETARPDRAGVDVAGAEGGTLAVGAGDLPVAGVAPAMEAAPRRESTRVVAAGGDS